ncbi:OmpA family protein [Frigoriflavimonas asaccharolytica]|uniref:Outer membrane protein OmpA-like peptidoglycan-associated protein n=1 Tax=Frigoriflavimonas asaccharolytica TaxID=2735899 RepID=A0A8J8G8H9_9FLAO|nr:OmpA family protein [Frigoriflavimonas asaccharolytica]NRS91887.1 outer membrane protein OmpA-like peptidoglycan-associated protein [Frigoriflavimonas asaccharolytica]
MKNIILKFLFFLSSFVSAQTIQSLYFQTNKADLNPISKSKLDSLANLKASLTFRIFGNADFTGSAEANKVLSDRRAKAVQDYLQARIGENLSIGNTIGLGETKQINDNSTEGLKQKNRRVDIFIERKFEPGEKISRKDLPNFLNVKVALMKVKDTFSLPDVNFIGGRHVWLPQSYYQLGELYKKLRDNPSLIVELQGHICCEYDNFDGEDLDLGTFNLSWTRAKAIQDFLLKQGIAENRIQIIGLGHLNPVVYPEVTEMDMTRNRRVEIMLIDK